MTKSLKEDFVLFVEDAKIYENYNTLNEMDKVDTDRHVFMKYFSSLQNAYEKIKTPDIDKSQGDITKIPGIGLMSGDDESLIFIKLNNIYKDSKKSPDAFTLEFLAALDRLTKNVIKNTNEFTSAFRGHNNLVSVIYKNAVLALVMGSEKLIAQTTEMNTKSGKMEFRKNLTKNEGSTTILNVCNKLNEMFDGGEFKKLTNSKITESVSLNEFFGVLSVVFGTVIVLVLLAKKMVWWFFQVSQSISDYLSTLAEFVTENYRLLDPKKDKDVITKQKKWSNKLNKMADKLDARDYNTSKKVNNTIKTDNAALNQSMSTIVSNKQVNSDVNTNGFIF